MKLNSGITGDETIVNWTNYVREVTHWVITSKQIGAEGYVIQVDESLFGGHRKNNVGRLFFKDFLGLNSNLNKRNNYSDRVQGP
ncbi:hypothetical protein HERIO_2320 [Hepatospora eriocheir]|uniref:ISXO2-like transposase domain-containing protein n=1 Tax=Hepatospora eriocheir TaxID=1081669 RepID=A0A1X0Q7D2_9MICR|nr:hypothetical protein HERIO_2320 [Hepatospora eriocheir]